MRIAYGRAPSPGVAPRSVATTPWGGHHSRGRPEVRRVPGGRPPARSEAAVVVGDSHRAKAEMGPADGGQLGVSGHAGAGTVSPIRRVLLYCYATTVIIRPWEIAFVVVAPEAMLGAATAATATQHTTRQHNTRPQGQQPV